MDHTLRTWALLAVDRTDEYDALTEYLPIAGGVLFRETLTPKLLRGTPAVALTFAPGVTIDALELEAAVTGRRLTRP